MPDFDAIVVGSGISGGWAAKELAERGLRTLVLEAGGPIDPQTDFVEHVQPWQMHFRGLGDRKALMRDYPVQRECYACDEMGHKFFVKDTEHPYTNPADAPFKWFRGRQVGGRSIMWGRQVYIARFRNVKTEHPGFLRGYGMQGGSSRGGWGRGSDMPGYGAAFKQSLIDDLGPWRLSASGWGETLPHADNRITLDPAVKDAWGVPAAHIDVRWRENELAMDKDMQTAMAEMLDAAGCTNIRQHGSDNPPGHCIHEMGGARMSKSPQDGVLNSHNQAWDVKNLFITDGACMASCACQNPSITYMALTARAAAFAVDAMKRKEL